MSAKEKLNELSELKSQLSLKNADKQALIDSVMTQEIKDKIREIEDEFSENTEHITQKMTLLEQDIRNEVSKLGETVKGDYLMAVFSKGRTSWDTRAMDGYIITHPELEQFRKVGDPSVSIRVREL